MFWPLGIFVLALVAIPDYDARLHLAQNSAREIDTIATQLTDKLNETDKKSIVVLDLEPAFGQSATFGSWLADQFSTSMARHDQTAVLIDRQQLKAVRESLHLSADNESDVKNAVAVGRSVGAVTVVVGSYQAVGNGIGLTLTAYRVLENGSPKFTICMIFGKIPLVREVTARLGVPVDSLKPKDGVYRSGYGGVTIPTCVKCSAPNMGVPDIDLQGMLRDHPGGATIWLQFVVTAEGHIQNVTVLHPVGYGFDEQFAKAASDWEFKPAVDADNRPVPATLIFHYSFNFK